ncbi:DUF2279 domain-containing protein [Ferruginibacter sp. SUN106]|uniref:DUF2279 domain-containing protein n=1 Tax=Ferruginibacter sp. SUN106 TaxID=2978348 RepID=UPI003D36A4F3
MNQTPDHKSISLASQITSRLSCSFSAMVFLLSFCFQIGATSVEAQDSSAKASLLPQKNYYFRTGDSIADSNKIKEKPLSKKQIDHRVKIIAATNIIGYSGAMVGLYSAWYKNYPQSNFHAFNDISEWKGIDKIGHAYSAYAESKASMELWRWTGIDRKKRIWLGGMSGAFYQTVIETLDGFSSEWGWSWGDFAANIVGSGMLVSQELAWGEQRIQFKFSFHHKTYSDPALIQRSNKIFGSSTAERFLKDYNGQTYWLSANIKSFFPESKIPEWLMLSVGTGAEGMFGANENIGKDANGNIIFNRTDIKRYRQWYLAPDIDLTKIKTNRKGIKVALNILNIVKFPMPSLEYSNGRFKLNAFTF